MNCNELDFYASGEFHEYIVTKRFRILIHVSNYFQALKIMEKTRMSPRGLYVGPRPAFHPALRHNGTPQSLSGGGRHAMHRWQPAKEKNTLLYVDARIACGGKVLCSCSCHRNVTMV